MHYLHLSLHIFVPPLLDMLVRELLSLRELCVWTYTVGKELDEVCACKFAVILTYHAAQFTIEK